MIFGGRRRKDASVKNAAEFQNLKERSDLLDDACGIGLWEAILYKGDAMDPKSIWTWSPEFRRLIGYDSVADYPNVVQSWSDRLHPDDVAPTFAAFGGHLTDKSGRARYDVVYRLKVRDGSYRWFRATGGCRHAADGMTIRACGSLTDIHQQKSTELQIAAEAAEDARTIDALVNGIAALARGDLTSRIDVAFPPKLETLKADFNGAVDKLRETITSITANAAAIRSGSNEIATAADDLSRRTEQQAASLEQTAAALDEITATVRKTAEGSKHARDVVGSAKEDAEHSGEVVRQAVEAMSGIEKSSVEIGQIIGAIDEIAFQTNLLALNAGVEAARAGDAGRGFAVVASEVRALAQRSADAAKQIKTLISASSAEVDQGVKLVGQTGQALGRIVVQVNEINGIVAEIAASAQEQATALDQVNTGVTQMDQVTQQNAAMVEQTTAASHQLSRETQELTRLVGRFDVGQGVPPAAASPTRKSGSPAKTSGSAKPVTAMKTMGRGGAAPKAEAASDSWEEF